MKFSKFLSFNFLIIALLLASCTSSSSNKKNGTTKGGGVNDIYQRYCSDGGTLNYEDFEGVLNRGAKGKLPNIRSGSTAPSNDTGESGDIYISTSSWDFYLKIDSEWSYMGNIRVEEQGLDYYLLDNSTYAVGLGNARYLSTVTIPEIHFGKTVTMIADSFYPSSLTDSSFNIERTFKLPDTISKIGENAFKYVPDTTTLEIPMIEEEFAEIDFGYSWANNFVIVELDDQTIAINDLFDNLEVRFRSSPRLNETSILSISVSTTKYGGIYHAINYYDPSKFECGISFANQDTLDAVTLKFSEENHAYVLTCNRMVSTQAYFRYKNYKGIEKIVDINVYSEDVMDRAFQNSLTHAGNFGLSFDYVNNIDFSSPSSSYLFLTACKESEIQLVGSTTKYHVTYEYKYRASVNGVATDVSTFIENMSDVTVSDNNQLTYIFLKNLPTLGTPDSELPHLEIDATVNCNGFKETKTAEIVLYPLAYTYEKVSLETLYGKNDETDEFNYLEEIDSVAYKLRENPYVEIQGRLVYVSPDHNFGIIRDGKLSIQAYQLYANSSMLNLIDSLIGQTVVIKATVTSSIGNIQLSYASVIHGVQERGYNNSKSLDSDITKTDWWNGNILFNQVTYFQDATVVDGQIYEVTRQPHGLPTTTEVNKASLNLSRKHYQFDVEIGGAIVSVITNYHTAMYEDASAAPFASKLATFFQTKLIAGAKINIGGVITWENSREDGEHYLNCVSKNGNWYITPLLDEHLI